MLITFSSVIDAKKLTNATKKVWYCTVEYVIMIYANFVNIPNEIRNAYL